MKKRDLEIAEKEFAKNREEIILKLLELAKTDLLFFWADKEDLAKEQQQKWKPILDWAGEKLQVALEKTSSLDVPENKKMQNPLAKAMHDMSNKELVSFYAVALNTRSILLAFAFVKKRINAKEANELAYLEELWQNEKWGIDEVAASKRKERLEELELVEEFLG